MLVSAATLCFQTLMLWRSVSCLQIQNPELKSSQTLRPTAAELVATTDRRTMALALETHSVPAGMCYQQQEVSHLLKRMHLSAATNDLKMLPKLVSPSWS
jgi:hypothetical protein